MAITCTWSVDDMTHKDADGGVVLVYWRMISKNDSSPTYTASDGGKLALTPDPSSPDYIPYADLTEADVLNWVYASLVEGDETPAEAKARVETKFTAKVQAQIDRANSESSGLPWAS